MTVTEIDKPLDTFETEPTHHSLFVPVLRYRGSNRWCICGSYATDTKETIIEFYRTMTDIEELRIFRIDNLPIPIRSK